MAAPTGRNGDPVFERFFRRCSVGIVLFDPSGIIARANPAFCRFLGLEPGHVVGRNWWNLLAGQDLQAALAAVKRLLGGEAEAVGFEVRCQAGSRSFRFGSLTAILHDGLLLAEVVDITARREAEEKLRRLESRVWPARQPCDLERIVRQRIEALPGAAALVWHIGELPVVESDPLLVARLLDDILIAYARSAAEVEIGCFQLGAVPVIFLRGSSRAADKQSVEVAISSLEAMLHSQGGRVWREGDDAIYFMLEREGS